MKTNQTTVLFLSGGDAARFCFSTIATQHGMMVIAVDCIEDAAEAANTYQFDFAVLDCSGISGEVAELEKMLDRNFVQTVYFTDYPDRMNDQTKKPVLDKNSINDLDLIQQISGEKPTTLFFIAALQVLSARARTYADDTYVAIEQMKRQSILRFVRRQK